MDSTTLRVNQTIFGSTDDGKTFPHKLQIDTSGGYSTINLNNANQLAAFCESTALSLSLSLPVSLHLRLSASSSLCLSLCLFGCPSVESTASSQLPTLIASGRHLFLSDDYAPDGKGGSSTSPGGCSFNLAIVDPLAVLNATRRG